MKKSQEQPSVQEPKKRGRRSKVDMQESTVLDDSDGAFELSKNLSTRRKATAGSSRKETVEQQEVKWDERGDQALEKDKFTEKYQSDHESSSLVDPFEDRGRWRVEEAVPSTEYEWLGLRTVEPISRPPILRLNLSNSARVAWASKDCTLSGAALRRARPTRPLEATFYDRIEAMCRVALSEVAKAKDGMEAVAVLGIVFRQGAIDVGR